MRKPRKIGSSLHPSPIFPRIGRCHVHANSRFVVWKHDYYPSAEGEIWPLHRQQLSPAHTSCSQSSTHVLENIAASRGAYSTPVT
ncbi:hypothetical protein CY35_05G104400 [Sphagnum magellanicum]|nr:hypothetical protein CY35_05G104400 [Sphagnum magellanicum]